MMAPGSAGVVEVDSGKEGMNESLALALALSPPSPGIVGSGAPLFAELLTIGPSAWSYQPSESS